MLQDLFFPRSACREVGAQGWPKASASRSQTVCEIVGRPKGCCQIVSELGGSHFLNNFSGAEKLWRRPGCGNVCNLSHIAQEIRAYQSHPLDPPRKLGHACDSVFHERLLLSSCHELLD